ncbi:MAG: hypothetical protein R3E93_14210 [Thiothrix sp.]
MELPAREHYLYHPYYCEENIWHLCQRPGYQSSAVMVMASRGEFFPILCQRTAESEDEPILWDYHVVLLWNAGQGARYILDFDTTLPFCTPVKVYFRQSFINETRLRREFIPLFRVIPAADYVNTLLSDRRHMKTASGWLAEPPPWPAISATESNLHKFTDMNDLEYGQVMTLSELLKYAHSHGVS